MYELARSFALVSLLAFPLSASVAGPSEPAPRTPADGVRQPKKPWEWTVEERLAVRLDPEKIAERQRAEEARYRAAGTRALSTRRETVHNYSVDGSRHPELLLPHELFQSLLTGFVSDDDRRRRKRESLRAGIVASGFDEELFWAQLRSAASEYIDTYAYPPSETVAALSSAREPYALCRAAATALTNARQVFGADRFDRFLYEIVAPRAWVASATNAADPAAELRKTEGGCQ